jgi:hypothetical protein
VIAFCRSPPLSLMLLPTLLALSTMPSSVVPVVGTADTGKVLPMMPARSYRCRVAALGKEEVLTMKQRSSSSRLQGLASSVPRQAQGSEAHRTYPVALEAPRGNTVVVYLHHRTSVVFVGAESSTLTIGLSPNYNGAMMHWRAQTAKDYGQLITPRATAGSYTRSKTDDDALTARVDTENAAGADPAHKLAFFRLDFANLADPGWPEQYLHYSIFVCTPRFTETERTRIKKDIPGAKLLAYFDTQFAMINKGCASSGDTPYYQAVNKYFKPEWAITDLRTGMPICLQSHTGWANTRPAGFVIMPQSADALSQFHREVTFGNASSWDGLYLDDSGTTYSEPFQHIITAQTTQFDIDADGRPDNISDITAQYMAFRPYFFAKLRDAVGPDRMLVANTGPPFAPDPNLNGITIESESCHQHYLPWPHSLNVSICSAPIIYSFVYLCSIFMR